MAKEGNIKIRYPGEMDSERIKRAKEIAAELSELALKTVLLLREMEQRLICLEQDHDHPEIKRLLDRLDVLRQLENQQEFQSWQITVDQILAEAWRRLP